MKYPNLNLFAAWFFMLETLAMGWIAAVGRIVLELLGVSTFEGDIPGRIVGGLLFFLAIFLVQHFMQSLPPQGKPEGKGFVVGHRIVLAGNLMGASLFIFQLFAAGIESYNLHLVLDRFTTAFGYFAMGCFAVGFSLIYQSALPQEKP
ncbi:MAG: hypothetical protein PHY62_05320 [Gallionella sp.]|jgi:hypothetical protein|nr:hypothetical protein [Gallionella sp.]